MLQWLRNNLQNFKNKSLTYQSSVPIQMSHRIFFLKLLKTVSKLSLQLLRLTPQISSNLSQLKGFIKLSCMSSNMQWKILYFKFQSDKKSIFKLIKYRFQEISLELKVPNIKFSKITLRNSMPFGIKFKDLEFISLLTLKIKIMIKKIFLENNLSTFSTAQNSQSLILMSFYIFKLLLDINFRKFSKRILLL